MNSEPIYKTNSFSNLDFYYSKRAIYYYLYDDFHLAISDYTKAIELNSNDPDNYYWRANSKVEISNYKGAIKDFTKCIDLDPDNIDAYSERVKLFKILKDYKNTITDYNKIIELKPSDVYSYNNLAWFTHLSGKSNDALVICNKGIEVDPDFALLYISRGEIKLGIGDSGEKEGLGSINDKVGACEDWQKAKSLGDLRGIASTYLSKYCK
jgi:tetratricopeptide (TPR) repeat protein